MKRPPSLVTMADYIVAESERERKAARATAVLQGVWAQRSQDATRLRARSPSDLVAEAQAIRETWQEYRWTGEFIPMASRVLGPSRPPPPLRHVFHRLTTDRCEVRGADGAWIVAREGACPACLARLEREERNARWAADAPRRQTAFESLLERLDRERQAIEDEITRLESEHV